MIVKRIESNLLNGSAPPVDKKADGSSDSYGQLETGSTRQALLLLILIFVTSTLSLVLVYWNFPTLEPEEKSHLVYPQNMEDAKNLGRVLSRYTGKHFFTVLSGFMVAYVFLQSFAIPGSIFLSILSGFLFPFPLALFLVCMCSAVGASICYLLSYLVGRRLVLKYVPGKVAQWSNEVVKHKSNLLNYIVFLRITPFLPNWFINIAAPVISVPLVPFFLGTFLGVAPPSFVAIQAGKTLNKLTSTQDAISFSSVLVLALFAVLSIIPVMVKGKLREKFQ